jgi:hypothetical protein
LIGFAGFERQRILPPVLIDQMNAFAILKLHRAIVGERSEPFQHGIALCDRTAFLDSV